MSGKRGRRSNGEGSIFYREDKGLWCASVTISSEMGKRKRKTLYAKSKDDLVAKKRELEASLTTQTYVEPARMTYGEFLDVWLARVCSSVLRPKTLLDYHQIVRNHIKPQIGQVQLQRLTPVQLQTLYNEKLASGLSTRTVRYIHAIVHRSLSQAVKWGYVIRNIAEVVDPPNFKKKEMTALDAAQIDLFLITAKGDWYYPLFVLALTTGLRQGELLGLQWSDVDLDRGAVQVKRTLQEVNGKFIVGEPKTNHSYRKVTLPQIAVDALKERHKQQSGEWVFTDRQGHLVRPSNMIRRSFKPLLKRASLPNIRFHDLRHSHATLLLQQGVNPKLVQERLGHSSITLTLDTYSHVLPNMQEQVVQQLDRFFSGMKA